MIIHVLLILVAFSSNIYVKCVQSFWSQKQTNLHRFSNLVENLSFCQVGCVLNDPQSRPRIDDPGRNIHDPFSVISTSYVVEVVGSEVGLIGHPLRVMVSEQTLSKNFITFFKWQSLTLSIGKLIQRISFNIKTEFEVTSHSTRREVFTVKIPKVVPHVILVYDYTLRLEGEATGVVLVGVSDYPQTIEVEVVRDDNRKCWIKTLNKEVFKNYLISVKVRGKNRHVLGKVSTIIQDKLIEDGFPFEMYMNEINKFTIRFLKEALLQENNVIKKNKILNNFCDIISNEPFRPPLDHDSSSSEDSRPTLSSEDNSSSKEDSSSKREDNSRSSREDSSSSRGYNSPYRYDDHSSRRNHNSPYRYEDRSSRRYVSSSEDNPCQDTCKPKCVKCKCKKNPCSNYKDYRRRIKIRIRV